MPRQRVIIITVIIFFIIAYIYLSYYKRTPDQITILQSTLEDFQFDMLHEKQPIVINDNIINLDQISEAWFPYNTKVIHSIQGDGNTWIENKHKYALLHAEAESDVYIAPGGSGSTPPDPENTILLAIHMQPGQLVIIPHHIKYCMAPEWIGKVLAVHDWITKWL